MFYSSNPCVRSEKDPKFCRLIILWSTETWLAGKSPHHKGCPNFNVQKKQAISQPSFFGRSRHAPPAVESVGARPHPVLR